MSTNARKLRDEPSDDQLANLELDSEVTVGMTPQQTKTQEQPVVDNLPPEFKGKSVNDLIKIIKDKESMIGRQAQEVGHLRDLSDRLLQSQAAVNANISRSSPQEEDVQLSSDDILEHPVDAIRRVVAPMLTEAVGEIKNTVNGVTAKSAMEQFKGRHPTYESDMSDPEFQKYVQASRYRLGLAVKAKDANDLDAADELWTGWEEHRNAQSAGDDQDSLEQKQQREAQQRQQELKDAATMRGGSGEGVSNAGGKKIYSARKLQELRNRDPDAYYAPAFQAALLEAYRENRVR